LSFSRRLSGGMRRSPSASSASSEAASKKYLSAATFVRHQARCLTLARSARWQEAPGLPAPLESFSNSLSSCPRRRQLLFRSTTPC
jgi:hypothetical protein